MDYLSSLEKSNPSSGSVNNGYQLDSVAQRNLAFLLDIDSNYLRKSDCNILFDPNSNLADKVSAFARLQGWVPESVQSKFHLNQVIKNDCPYIQFLIDGKLVQEMPSDQSNAQASHSVPGLPSIREEIIPACVTRLGRHVMVVAGPGGTAFKVEDVGKINASIAQHGSSGLAYYHNGSSSLQTVQNDVVTALEEMKNSKDKITLYVYAHSIMKNEEHCINLDGEYKPTKTFFMEIAAKTNKPVDIFFTGCHGGGAIRDAHYLPGGSTLAVLSPEKQTTVGSDVFALNEALHSTSDMSAKSILLLHCTIMKTRIPNAIWHDGKTYELELHMKEMLGNHFSEEEYSQIHAQLDKLSGQQRIDEVMEKMKNARHEFDIPAKDYGMALAIAGALVLSEVGT